MTNFTQIWSIALFICILIVQCENWLNHFTVYNSITNEEIGINLRANNAAIIIIFQGHYMANISRRI